MDKFSYHHKHSRFRYHRAYFYDRRRRRPFCCVNCGKEGHAYKDCLEPITSFGIIAIRSNKNKDVLPGPIACVDKYKCPKHEKLTPDDIPDVDISQKYDILYFMVQRKDTMGYIDLIRGKYPDKDVEKRTERLKTYLEEMTCDERRRLRDCVKDRKQSSTLEESLVDTESLKNKGYGFEELWDVLWCNHESRLFINEFSEAKLKFEKLNIKKLLKETECNWTEQEYGFPKGRKNKFETNLECAKREFKEETGYNSHEIRILSEKPWEEIFVGTNGIKYRHVYYIAEVPDDVGLPKVSLEEIQDRGEISNFGWFTFDQCMKIIRPYDTAKKELLQRIHDSFLSYFSDSV